MYRGLWVSRSPTERMRIRRHGPENDRSPRKPYALFKLVRDDLKIPRSYYSSQSYLIALSRPATVLDPKHVPQTIYLAVARHFHRHVAFKYPVSVRVPAVPRVASRTILPLRRPRMFSYARRWKTILCKRNTLQYSHLRASSCKWWVSKWRIIHPASQTILRRVLADYSPGVR